MTERRDFLKGAALGLATTAVASNEAIAARKAREAAPPLTRQGPKEVVRAKRAVASSQSPIVTQTMLDTLRAGGNAVDACIAGCITQATVQPEMTNHTGTVSALVFEAKTGKVHYLNSMGTLHPTLPPFRTYPPGVGGVAAGRHHVASPRFIGQRELRHSQRGDDSETREAPRDTGHKKGLHGRSSAAPDPVPARDQQDAGGMAGRQPRTSRMYAASAGDFLKRDGVQSRKV